MACYESHCLITPGNVPRIEKLLEELDAAAGAAGDSEAAAWAGTPRAAENRLRPSHVHPPLLGRGATLDRGLLTESLNRRPGLFSQAAVPPIPF